MTFAILKKVHGDVYDVNTKAVKNVSFRCKVSFSDVLDVVAPLYNLSKRVYSCVMDLADGIFPSSIITWKWFFFKPPLFPPADLSDTLHASLNMFSAEEHYVSLPVM